MSRPNIIMYMTDQQRADTIYPECRAITPNINSFASQSASFVRTYCPAPHCCPSRASLFSGLYPSQHGIWNNVDVGNCLSQSLYSGVKLFTQELKSAGYGMYFSGKWHVSKTASPLSGGFDKCFPYQDDYYKKTCQKLEKPDTYEWDHYYKNMDVAEKWFNVKGHSTDGKRISGQLIRDGYLTYSLYGIKDKNSYDEQVVKQGIEYIREASRKEEPFMVYVGPTQPHDPYLVPKKYLDLYKDIEISLPDNFYDSMADKPGLYRRTRDRFAQMTQEEYKDCILHYLAMCSYQDDLFGNFITEIKEAGVYENSIILYLSDHGDYCGEHGLFAKGLPCFESAYRIPLVIGGGYLEKESPPQIIDDFVTITDIAPTLLEWAGLKPEGYEGNSLAGYFDCSKTLNKRDAVYTQTNGNELYGIQRSIRTKNWKLVYNGFDYDELYNLETDPGETVNLSEKPGYGEIKKQLMKKLWQFAYEHDDTCINPYVMVSLAQVGPGVIFDKDNSD